MPTRRRRGRPFIVAALLGVMGTFLFVLPASGEPPDIGDRIGLGVLVHMPQPAVFHYWRANPEFAPPSIHGAIDKLGKGAPGAPGGRAAGQSALFNLDATGLPQNEESISSCRSDQRVVLGGTNDYRGLLDPQGNFTGWQLSTDGGATVRNEGLLPAVTIMGEATPSGGDPIDIVGDGCSLYAVSLNFSPTADFLTLPNGIGLYKTDVATLTGCPGGADPSCWPTRRAAAVSPNVSGQTTFPSHFFDKPWGDVGKSGDKEYVWIVYSDFFQTGPGTDTLDYTVSIKAVRCTTDLATCTQPILISGNDQDVQFSDVTIGPDGRVYVTWAEIQGELPGSGGAPSQPQTFVVKLRIAPAGSTTFGPTRTVATVTKAIPFDGTLHANGFRIATYPKNAVALSGSSHGQGKGDHGTPGHGSPPEGKPRIFVTWDECRERVLDTICEEPEIKLAYSDDDGANWQTSVASTGGDNYFPTISADGTNGKLALAWYTSAFDPDFHNRQDVVVATVDAATAQVSAPTRLTQPSNEPEADPLLGPVFIGDYFETFAYGGRVLTHFNANYRQIPLLGLGLPVNQQDNFLVTSTP